MVAKKISELNTVNHTVSGQQFTVVEDNASTKKVNLRKVNPALAANISSPLVAPVASGLNSLAIGQSGSISSGIGSVQIGTGNNTVANSVQFLGNNFANQETLQVKMVSGVPTDLTPNGSIEIDSLNKEMYYRSSNTWFKASKEPYVRILGTNVPTSLGNDSLAIGDSSSSIGNQSVAIKGVATGDKSVTIGGQSIGEKSIAIGYLSEANSLKSVAIGSESKSQGLNSIAIGSLSETKGNNSIAIGKDCKSLGIGSVAIGKQAEVLEPFTNCVAIGTRAKVSANGGTSIGTDSLTSSVNGVAIGKLSLCSNNAYAAVGSNSQATAQDSVAIGLDSIATGESSLAIGKNAEATAQNSVQIGTGVNPNAETLQFFNSISLNGDGGFPIKLQSTGNPPIPGSFTAAGQMIFDTVSKRLWMPFTSPTQNRYLQLT